MNSFPKAQVLAACQQHGPALSVPPSLDPVRVMIAIASNESSLGADCGPRHEPAYEAGGAHWAQAAMTPLLALYPPAGDPPESPAACSYGPWQMMFLNFTRGLTPEQLESDLDLCAREFVRWFDSYVASKIPQCLADIGDIWNLGHIAPDPAYTNKLQAAYDAAATEAKEQP
jgi:hypothetical protein